MNDWLFALAATGAGTDAGAADGMGELPAAVVGVFRGRVGA